MPHAHCMRLFIPEPPSSSIRAQGCNQRGCSAQRSPPPESGPERPRSPLGGWNSLPRGELGDIGAAEQAPWPSPTCQCEPTAVFPILRVRPHFRPVLKCVFLKKEHALGVLLHHFSRPFGKLSGVQHTHG